MAQDITGTELAATAIAGVRQVVHRVKCYWDGVNGTDETAYVKSWSTEMQSANLGVNIATFGNAMSGSASVVLRNEAGRFSQLKSGAVSAAMYHTKVTIEAGFKNSSGVGEYLNQFTGYVVGVTEDKTGGTVTLDCDDISAMLRHRRVSTQVYAPLTPSTYNGSAGAYIQKIIDAVNADLPAGRQISTSLDAGRFGLDYAWCEDDSAWEEITTVAEADGGRLYFDHSGVLHYEDATHLLIAPHDTSVFTFTGAYFSDLGHQWQWQSPPVNHVVVNVMPRYVGAEDLLYTCGEHLRVKAGASITHKAEFNQAAWAIIDPVSGVDFVAITAGGMDKTDSVTVTGTATARKATLTIANSHAYETLHLHLLQLRGYPILQRQVDKVEDEDATSIAAYGKVTQTIQNPYIQSRRHAEAIRDMVLDRRKSPMQATALSGIPCIPWLELGDRVTVTDAASGTNHAFYIVGDMRGIDFSSPDSATFVHKRLTLLPATGLFPRTDYFEVARTALGPAGGKLFY